MPLFPDSFIRLLCLVIHSSVHLFRDSEDRRDMLGKRYVFQSLDLEQETFNVKFWYWKYSLDWHDGIISWVRGDGALETKFWLKITLLPREIFLVSINNIVISSFPRVLLPMTSKGRQVANGNGAGFPWKQHKLDLVTKLLSRITELIIVVGTPVVQQQTATTWTFACALPHISARSQSRIRTQGPRCCCPAVFKDRDWLRPFPLPNPHSFSSS